MDWRVLQIADSAFPTGGFAHSAGLEAAAQLGEIRGAEEVASFVDAALWQAGHQALPFIGAAHTDPMRIGELDATCDALLTSHVANRASRTQGRAFAATCARVFDHASLHALDEACRTRAIRAHFAPAFGAALRALEVECADARALFLHATARGIVSAAVRLGLTGPHEAQRILAARAVVLDLVLERCQGLAVDDAAQTSPLVELFGMAQNRLYCRLFQS